MTDQWLNITTITMPQKKTVNCGTAMLNLKHIIICQVESRQEHKITRVDTIWSKAISKIWFYLNVAQKKQICKILQK